MTVEAEFFVEDVVTDKAGRLAFVGFPNQGRGVLIGDEFLVRYEIHRTLDDVLNERPMGRAANQRSVSLRVTAISSMRKLIEELPLGMTGALYLEGDGVEYVTKRTFLTTADLVS